jgi:hypothetical protein
MSSASTNIELIKYVDLLVSFSGVLTEDICVSGVLTEDICVFMTR